MPTLPQVDPKRLRNESPHVVILGAGASLAAFPRGDASGVRLPLMANLVDIVGVRDLLLAGGVTEPMDNFEALYDGLATKPEHSVLRRELERATAKYFSRMCLPNEATIYDYLLLSLREKDLIATFNWDPFLAQAYARNAHLRKLPQIYFLHGNVQIGVCRKHRRKGFVYQRCGECSADLEPTPLLFPVRHKDYITDEFIASEWELLRYHLRYAYMITIFGYSAPTTDAEAREMMLGVWRENDTRELAQIQVIDVKRERELRETWREFIIRDHVSATRSFFHSYLALQPRRTCDAFAMATLQMEPWHHNPWPRFRRLDSLHRWIAPLLREEEGGVFSGQPCARTGRS